MSQRREEAGAGHARAPLAKGDRVYGSPCLVTIERVDDLLVDGRCETCEDRHLIDRRRYESGDGPWRLVYSAEGRA